MHNHQKKTLLKKIKSSDFSYCCNSFQVFICKLNSALNLKHRKHVKQITKSHKKKAFLQKKKISDFLFLNCFCRQNRETSKHVMIYYVKHSETHKKLEINE